MSEEEATLPPAAAPAPEEEAAAPAPAEEESTAQFTPVVQLEEVEVTTGEEEEEVVYTKRAKLFEYGETLLDVGTGKKTWKERGIGDARILRHRDHGRLRFLMRQEKTMKIIANHAIDPRIELTPNITSDRSWVWSAFDFCEGELVEKVFAVRFGDSDIANEFKKEFEAAQAEMKTLLEGEDNPGADGGAAADEAAEALAGLTTKEEGETAADDAKKDEEEAPKEE